MPPTSPPDAPAEGTAPQPAAPASSIARNTMIDSGAQIAGLLFGLAAGVVLARYLGVDGRGRYVLATAFAGQLMLSFVNFGFELSASVLVAKDRTRLSRLHTTAVIACVLLAFVLTGILQVGREFIQEHILPGIRMHALLALWIALPFWVYQYACYGLLTGLGANRTRAFFDLGVNFIQNLVTVILLVRLHGGDEDVTVRALTLSYYGILICGSFVLFGLLVWRGVRWEVPDFTLAREFLGYGFWVFVGNIGNGLSQRVDQYFVQKVTRDEGAFGVYTLATSLASRTRIFPQALSRSSYARICSSPQAEAALLVAACFRQMLVLSTLLLVVGAALSPLIPWIYSREFAPAVLPFVIFLVGRGFANCSWMLANYFTGHLGRPEVPFWVNWGILPVQALLAWVALKLGGLLAVAAITSLTYFLTFLILLVLFLRVQPHAGLKQLFRPTLEDLTPWRRLLRRMVGAR